MENKTYIIAAGGTSGHINPAIAIADEIKKNEPGANIVFCGTEKGLENSVVPNHGYKLLHIDAIGFPTRLSKQLFLAVAAYFKGRRQSMDIIRKINPDLVIGTGGYVCGPMVSMANSMGVPTLLHEQNAFPGKANRFLSKKSTVVCISFEKARLAFSKAKKVVLTGNPVRDVFYGITKEEARKQLGIRENEKILFVTGGSLGAKTINKAIVDLVKNYSDLDYRVILSCGKKAYPGLMEEMGFDEIENQKNPKKPENPGTTSIKSEINNETNSGIDNKTNSEINIEIDKYKSVLDLKDYLFDQHLYLASADIVLCRSGALTCSEIAMLGKASIMVPYPYATGDHQTLNAATFEEIGACILVKDKDLSAKWLHNSLQKLFSATDTISKMEVLSKSLAMPQATSQIYQEIIKITEKKANTNNNTKTINTETINTETINTNTTNINTTNTKLTNMKKSNTKKSDS